MKKISVYCLCMFMMPLILKAQDIYTSKDVTFSFFSTAPIEDIKASTTKGVSAIDIQAKSIYFKVSIRSFKFAKSLMQEHFNEDYLESSKYPFAEFKGKIERSE